jgi:hypothetical protein
LTTSGAAIEGSDPAGRVVVIESRVGCLVFRTARGRAITATAEHCVFEVVTLVALALVAALDTQSLGAVMRAGVFDRVAAVVACRVCRWHDAIIVIARIRK